LQRLSISARGHNSELRTREHGCVARVRGAANLDSFSFQFGSSIADWTKQEGLEIARVSKAFANDILLALSCRESGCVLVTENIRDFSRIRQFISFDYIKPWPADLPLVDRD